MSENINNPLNDFLNGDTGSDNNLFEGFPFDTEGEIVTQPQQTADTSVPQDEPKEAEPAKQPSTNQQPTLFTPTVVQTPVAADPEPSSKAASNTSADPFAEALARAKANSEERLAESFAEEDAIFAYGKAKDPITDRDCTFEDLRQKYENDFPELSDSKRVTWSVVYGKVTKSVSNPGSDKVYDIKSEIEKSKTFLDGIKKAKNDADKKPQCLVKAIVKAQNKGEQQIPAYKDYCLTVEDAEKSDKPIVILPSRDGRIFQIRKTPVGTFTAPAGPLPEFPIVNNGFKMSLPKIPMHILMFILNFFKELSDRSELEALVHILYDTKRQKYTIRVPKQELTHTSVYSILEEEYPEHLIHVMDIHSHNTMPARFSTIDNEDEKATRLYAVAGRFDLGFPEITVRASCGGQFIPLNLTDVFDINFKAYPYPELWDKQLTITHKARLMLPMPKSFLPHYGRRTK